MRRGAPFAPGLVPAAIDGAAPALFAAAAGAAASGAAWLLATRATRAAVPAASARKIVADRVTFFVGSIIILPTLPGANDASISALSTCR